MTSTKGTPPITPDFVLKLGWAVGMAFRQQGKCRVLVGKDTRISGYMFESALEAGLSAAGADVMLLGPMPTPGIAYLTRTFHAEAGIVIADGRKYVSALIQLEFDTVGKWAESRRIAFTHFRSLAESAPVRELIQQEVARANAGLAPVAQIKRFHLLTKELDHDDGEVTATMKVRRASIYRSYAGEIEALYAEETAA